MRINRVTSEPRRLDTRPRLRGGVALVDVVRSEVQLAADGVPHLSRQPLHSAAGVGQPHHQGSRASVLRELGQGDGIARHALAEHRAIGEGHAPTGVGEGDADLGGAHVEGHGGAGRRHGGGVTAPTAILPRMTDPTDLRDVMTPTLWTRDGWTARVIKNEDDDGWAVEMTRDGDPEAALVGPWTMGRDKKNPKPLDTSAFLTLVKTANDVLVRHANQARARLHRALDFVRDDGERVSAALDIAPDEDDPHAILVCRDTRTGEELRRGRVPPNYRLNAANLEKFLVGQGSG